MWNMICLARVIAKPNWVRIWLDWLGPDCTSISSPDPSKKRENHLPAQKLSNLQTFQIQKICEQWNNLSQKGLDLIIFLCWKHILELLSSPDMVCNSAEHGVGARGASSYAWAAGWHWQCRDPLLSVSIAIMHRRDIAANELAQCFEVCCSDSPHRNYKAVISLWCSAGW